MIPLPPIEDLLEQLSRWKAIPSAEIDRPLSWEEAKRLIADAGSAASRDRFRRAVDEKYGGVFPLIGALCAQYLEVTAAERARARTVVAGSSDLVRAVDHWRPERGSSRTAAEYRADDPARWLRLYLARISLTDGAPDWRDHILDVEHLRTELAREGFDARPIFEQMANLSEPTARGVILRGIGPPRKSRA